MKRLLLFIIMTAGLAIVQAQSIAASHDVTASITDSVRIVPKFSVGDTRTYLVTNTTRQAGDFKDSTSVEYRFTVESVDDDHYAIYFIANNMKSEMPQGMKMILDIFCNKGCRFYINRHDLTVDSVSGDDLKEPLREYFSKFFGMMQAQYTDSTELEQAVDEQLTDDFLTEAASKVLRALAETFIDQYGRTYALGASRWIENNDETVEDVESSDGTVVQDIDDEMDDEELFDFSIQIIHQAFAHINEDGTFFYQEQITWDSQLLDNWHEQSEVAFDSKGWTTEISKVVNTGEISNSIHWQLINDR